MQILRARPLATATLLAISASVLSFFLGPIGKMVLLMSSLLALLALILLYLLTARRGLRFSNPGTALMMSILICMMTSVTVFASWYHFHPASNIPREIIDDNTTHDVSFCIVEEGNAGIGYTYYTVSLRSIDGATVRGRATLECIYTATYHVGDVLSAKVSLISLENYYDTDNLYYAISDGIRAVLSHEADAVIEKIGYEFMPVRRFFTDMRNSLSARLLSLTGKENGGLATALFLGDREVLDQRITKDFRRTGVSHLLALSGLHLSVLAGALDFLLRGFALWEWTFLEAERRWRSTRHHICDKLAWVARAVFKEARNDALKKFLDFMISEINLGAFFREFHVYVFQLKSDGFSI